MQPKVQIVNVVVTAALNHRLDLEAICATCPNAEYRPEQFPGLVFRLKKPKTATLLFSTGRMVCTGAKSPAQAKLAVGRVVRELRSKGIVIPGNPEVHVQNIVASVNLGGEVDVEKTVHILERVLYEPEQFPGVIYRMQEPRVVILIFATGKLVVTGAKKEEDVYAATDKLQRRLEEAGSISYGEAPRRYEARLEVKNKK